MDTSKPDDILSELLSLPFETEWVEFKSASNNFDVDKLGQYFSAISNEANLHRKSCGWIVFGVEDKFHKIVSTRFRLQRRSLENLKHEIAAHTTSNISFTEIIELNMLQGRVLLFKIPHAPKGIPVAWKGHFYGRDGESLVALNLQKIEVIRSQSPLSDWSAEICESATLDDLDIEAIKCARIEFKKKYILQASDVNKWDDATFLNKAKITIRGKITNTAIVLLGKRESSALISPAVAKISWILKDSNNIEKDYQHFVPPFILSVNSVFDKIRNLTIRHLPDRTLFPIETTQYDPWVLREALHNCIAHQDYRMNGRINVVETPTTILFTNVGSFLPGSVEKVITQDAHQEIYRNQFLAEAMVHLNMIDTQGGGIKKMYSLQVRRFFPLPDYDLSDPNYVLKDIQKCLLQERTLTCGQQYC
jgi:ATP-dependent DNA helicase RecG